MTISFTPKVNKRSPGSELAITNEVHTVSLSFPCTIKLIEVPLKDTPTTVLISGFTEVRTLALAPGQFVVNYSTGYVTFDPSASGASVSASYKGTGSIVDAQDVNDIQDAVVDTASEIVDTTNEVIDARGSLPSLQDRLDVSTNPDGTLLVSGGSGAIQFNSSNSLVGDASNLFWDSTNKRLGLGTSSPSATLTVLGNVKIVDGTQSNGKVLTSDANGLASWQTAGSSGVSGTGSAGQVTYWNGTSSVTGDSNFLFSPVSGLTITFNASTLPGPVTIKAGPNATPGSGHPGGLMTLTGGDATGTAGAAPGGSVLIRGGIADTFGDAPTIFFDGSGNFAQSPGSVYILGGAGVSTNGGYIRARGTGDVDIFGNGGGIGGTVGSGTGNITLTPGTSGGRVFIGTGSSSGAVQIGGSSKVGIANGSPSYALDVTGDINASGTYRTGGTPGVSGTFTTTDLKTVTVINGIITSIV